MPQLSKLERELPKGGATRVKCQIHFGPVPEGMPMIFEPKEDGELPDGLELGEELTKITPGTSSHVTILVSNNTQRNILLKPRTELGRVHMVKSVLPIPNPPDQICTRGKEKPYSEATSHQGHKQDKWEPPVDFGQLEENKQLIVREMLRQEAGAFARTDDDVGCVENVDRLSRIEQENISRKAADSPNTRYLKWSGRQQMVYSSGPREGLPPKLHGRRKSPPHCMCDPLGIVSVEQNTVWAYECTDGLPKVYE